MAHGAAIFFNVTQISKNGFKNFPRPAKVSGAGRNGVLTAVLTVSELRVLPVGLLSSELQARCDQGRGAAVRPRPPPADPEGAGGRYAAARVPVPVLLLPPLTPCGDSAARGHQTTTL